MALQCEIVTPESRIFSAEANFVVIPASEGEMGVYEQHQPVVTTLKAGSVRVTEHDGKEPLRYIIAGGYAQVGADHVTVLADRAAAAEELDSTEIRIHIDEMKEQLADLKDDDPNAAFQKSEIEWFELVVELSDTIK